MSDKIVRKHSRARIEEMVRTLRGEIVSGHYALEQFLPSESDLEKRFRLGNGSVRKGLEVLVEEGLITKIPKVGNKVTGSAAEECVTVRLGVYTTTDSETELSALLELFHRRYPAIRVQTVLIPTSEYASFVREQMDAGMLDAATINYNTFRGLSAELKERLLEPLEPSEDCYPFASGPFVHNDSLLVRPLMFSPLVLCYNKDHLQELGLPEPAAGWSWDKLLEVASKLAVENSRFGFCFHLLSRNRWPVFLLQSGIRFLPDGDGVYRLPEDRLIECLDVCRTLINRPDVFPTMLSGRDGTTVEWFLDGKVSMIMTTYFALNRLKHADFTYDLAPLPTVKEDRTLLTMIGAVVSRQSEVKESARLLVDFLGSREAQSLIRRHTLSIPANRAAAEAPWEGEETFRRPSRFDVYRELIPSYRLLEHLPASNRDLQAMQKEVELYWTGLQDGETTCRRIEQALQEANAKPN
ncbi:extracellular solute-binding protein [Paenibacillus hodogayensis]|uniref:Extracellular solute-binding protein n=1 Tax=Paenibacillus hodogayensis TaxID=279208 RepID=A0ABV5VZU9_9BACL